MHNERRSELADKCEKRLDSPDAESASGGDAPSQQVRGISTIEDRGRQFQLLVSGVRDYAIYMLDPDGVVVSWNDGAERIKGYTEAEIVGENFARFYTQEDQRAGAPAHSLQKAREECHFEAEAQRVRKDGSLFWANVIIDPIYNEAGQLIGFAKITRDISERRRDEERLRKLAMTDSLTELPNRATLTTRLDNLMAQGIPVAVLMLDLDGFKDTNDSFGHEAGDALLKAAGRRIQDCVGDCGIVARWGGDEFAAVLAGVADTEIAATVGRELIAAFEPPFDYEGHEVQLGLSIGIAFALNSAAREETLTNADLALYRAKAEGRNRLSFYEPKLREQRLARKKIESELRQATARGEFELFFQPQVALQDDKVVGAEALLRWRHPERGVLSPAAFITALGESANAHVVGDWVIREACMFAARVRAEGFPDFQVGVNVFGAQFRRGRFVSSTLEALRDNNLAPDAMIVEITEDIVLRHEAAMIQPLQMLRSLGVGIAFDDYGTGFASLSLLKRYPLTMLKVDKGFIRDLCWDNQDKSVTKAIIYLGHSFDLDVIAEGIESDEQAETLRALGCLKGQGYLYGRPMPAEQFMRWLQNVSEGSDTTSPQHRHRAG